MGVVRVRGLVIYNFHAIYFRRSPVSHDIIVVDSLSFVSEPIRRRTRRVLMIVLVVNPMYSRRLSRRRLRRFGLGVSSPKHRRCADSVVTRPHVLIVPNRGVHVLWIHHSRVCAFTSHIRCLDSNLTSRPRSSPHQRPSIRSDQVSQSTCPVASHVAGVSEQENERHALKRRQHVATR